GLAVGEPPTTKGYTPTVFATLPKLLERAGRFQGQGSITGLYTVLVDGDDLTEPVADSVRSILDGHIVLSRDLAARNHYPAIDVLNSTSRIMRDVTSPRHQELAGRARTILATHQEAEDLINIGAYVKGSNPGIDFAISKIEAINRFLRQNFDETASLKQSIEELGLILSERKDEDRQPKLNRRVSDKER
ncbi:MAG: flagellum-specific ATP synthase FliI, partial [Desulfofustis sp.]|nr:flagellum-specific ATP synthase FliI [Desulfofustis sp.]